MTRSLAFVIRNKTSDLATVRDTLDRLGSELPIPKRALIHLQVALDEIASNIIKYSWSDDARHEFIVQITVRPDAVRLDIIDDGSPFDPRSSPAPRLRSAERPPPGGLGIYMTKKLMDGLDYQRIDGRNHTTLTKKCMIGAVAGEENER